MRPPLAHPATAAAPLAPVIPLDASRRAQQADGDLDRAPGAPASPDAAELAHALAALRRLAGERGLELPPAVGRRLARMERLLAGAPTGIDAARVVPALAAEIASLATAAGRVTVELVPEEAAVLGAALGTDLADLPLADLHEIADAVLAVSRAPRGADRWGEPGAAEAAEAVISAAAGDLRDAVRTHEWLYERFSDRVWELPPRLLERGRRRWRVVARARLRRQLRLASRTGRIPGTVTAALDGISEARIARGRVAAVDPLLSQHLGPLHRGPLSNADDALRAVRAIRRLHVALGPRVDPQQMRRLILADGFRSEDVFGPAVNLRMALRAWERDVEGFGGRDPWALTLEELADWIEACLRLLPDLRDAAEAAVTIGAAATTLRSLVDLHLLREHVTELAAVAARAGEDQGVGS